MNFPNDVDLIKKGNKVILKGDFGSHHLYLTPAMIERNLKKYNMSFPLPQHSTRDLEVQRRVEKYENLMQAALNNDFKARLIMGLLTRRQFERNELSKKEFQDEMSNQAAFQRDNTSLFCDKTQKILKTAASLLIGKLGTHPTSAHLQLAVGCMIFVLVFQDKEYGEQDIYNKQLLYPAMNYDQMDVINKNLKDKKTFFNEIGKLVLVDKSLPLSVQSLQQVFPEIFKEKEFAEFIMKHASQKHDLTRPTM